MVNNYFSNPKKDISTLNRNIPKVIVFLTFLLMSFSFVNAQQADTNDSMLLYTQFSGTNLTYTQIGNSEIEYSTNGGDTFNCSKNGGQLQVLR